MNKSPSPFKKERALSPLLNNICTAQRIVKREPVPGKYRQKPYKEKLRGKFQHTSFYGQPKRIFPGIIGSNNLYSQNAFSGRCTYGKLKNGKVQDKKRQPWQGDAVKVKDFAKERELSNFPGKFRDPDKSQHIRQDHNKQDIDDIGDDSFYVHYALFLFKIQK